jgi:hypothetical protein
MRKPDAALATNTTPDRVRRDRASRELVCLALILAIGAMLLRVATMW